MAAKTPGREEEGEPEEEERVFLLALPRLPFLNLVFWDTDRIRTKLFLESRGLSHEDCFGAAIFRADQPYAFTNEDSFIKRVVQRLREEIERDRGETRRGFHSSLPASYRAPASSVNVWGKRRRERETKEKERRGNAFVREVLENPFISRKIVASTSSSFSDAPAAGAMEAVRVCLETALVMPRTSRSFVKDEEFKRCLGSRVLVPSPSSFGDANFLAVVALAADAETIAPAPWMWEEWLPHKETFHLDSWWFEMEEGEGRGARRCSELNDRVDDEGKRAKGTSSPSSSSFASLRAAGEG